MIPEIVLKYCENDYSLTFEWENRPFYNVMKLVGTVLLFFVGGCRLVDKVLITFLSTTSAVSSLLVTGRYHQASNYGNLSCYGGWQILSLLVKLDTRNNSHEHHLPTMEIAGDWIWLTVPILFQNQKRRFCATVTRQIRFLASWELLITL